jgi:hypothetical protein
MRLELRHHMLAGVSIAAGSGFTTRQTGPLGVVWCFCSATLVMWVCTAHTLHTQHAFFFPAQKNKGSYREDRPAAHPPAQMLSWC